MTAHTLGADQRLRRVRHRLGVLASLSLLGALAGTAAVFAGYPWAVLVVGAGGIVLGASLGTRVWIRQLLEWYEMGQHDAAV